jgi:hypothetical protein
MTFQIPPGITAFSNRILGTGWKRLVGLLVLLVEEITLGLLTDALRWLGGWLVAIGQRPMGTFFAVLLVVLTVGILWAALDPIRLVERLRRSPRVRHTDEQRRAIDDVRQLWNTYGREASDTLELLLEGRTRIVKKHIAYGWLLDRVVAALKERSRSLSQALDESDPEPFYEVSDRLHALTDAYWLAAGWTNRSAVEVPACTENEAATYDHFVMCNASFHEHLEELKGRKAFKGRTQATVRANGREYRLGFESHWSSDGHQPIPLSRYVEKIAATQKEADAAKREVERRDDAVARYRKRADLLRVPLETMVQPPWLDDRWLDDFPSHPESQMPAKKSSLSESHNGERPSTESAS